MIKAYHSLPLGTGKPTTLQQSLDSGKGRNDSVWRRLFVIPVQTGIQWAGWKAHAIWK